ncbi:MAG TPA: energy transducer TonB [Longimicrobium sp.]|nr:energy transducer TonB [Longimicrobium sp.]
MTRPTAKTAAALAAALLLAGCEREPVPETPPRQVSESPFQYPEELWDAQVEGQSTLRLFISDRGTVDTARLEKSSGYAAFDSAALAGSRQLRFEPATRGGEAVAAWFLLPVQFELNPADSAAAAPTTAPPAAGGDSARR